MRKIIGLSGSLRLGSYNSALLRAAEQLQPDRLQVAGIADIPLYNADLERGGLPAPVEVLKRQIAGAPGLLLASPEYNSSVPGVLKNAIDWLSRPSDSGRNVFEGKCVALMGATPGGFGTCLGQAAWLPVFRALGARLFSGGRMLVSSAGRVFDEDGRLADGAVKERLADFLEAYVAFCER